MEPRRLVDSHGRQITYVRISVTDRCNLRCVYCMPEDVVFMDRSHLLTFEEITHFVRVATGLGIDKVRLTGGEPLMRRDLPTLVRLLSAIPGIRDIGLTTNALLLADQAQALYDAGLRRINVSLDTLDPRKFAEITRGGDLALVLDGIEGARDAGLAVKINMVALKGVNESEFAAMLAWGATRDCDLTLIETMPLGEVPGRRADGFLPLAAARAALEAHYSLLPSTHRTGGPARYYEVVETGTRVGFITPLSANFCASCNRIRVAATGTVYGCLGHDQRVELRDIMRLGPPGALDKALDRLLAGKPARHDFDIARTEPAVARHMSVTGG